MISTPASERGEGGYVKLPIGLLNEQYEWLRTYSFRNRLKMAEVMRMALERYRVQVDPQLGLPIPPGEGSGG